MLYVTCIIYTRYMFHYRSMFLANGRTLHASPLATGRQRDFPSMPRPFGARIRWRFYGIDGPLKGVIYIYMHTVMAVY